MKKQLDYLVELSKDIDLEMFYTIDITKGSIKLQGDYKPETAQFFKVNGFTASLEANGYVVLTHVDNPVIRIVLT